ncbi:hypothetical protein IU475_33985 [Nocardia beijingensis]|nr:hypothetical protein [Nocardia beijingensis]
MKLTFSEPIQPSFAALTVTRPDGQRWERSEPKVNNRDVSVDLDGRGPAAPSPSHSGSSADVARRRVVASGPPDRCGIRRSFFPRPAIAEDFLPVPSGRFGGVVYPSSRFAKKFPTCCSKPPKVDATPR